MVVDKGASRRHDQESLLVRACRGENVERIPVWFMRQAGRALPEYRKRRGSGTILDVLRDPELVAELTMQPVRRYAVDAAILFSDIVVPVAATGFGVDVVAGQGPVIADPFRFPSDLLRLRPFEPEVDAPYVASSVSLIASQSAVPVIGFAGAPFTVASYLVEGGASRTFARTKALMHCDPGTWFALVDKLADMAIASLSSQVNAGASVIQLFDSWAGALTRADYERFVLPATSKVLAAAGELGVPRIHFGVGTGELLDLMAQAGTEVIGVDWRVPLSRARDRIGKNVSIQGNLDPAICLAPFEIVAKEVLRVLNDAGGTRGHIFNLGHGVLPETDPDTLAKIVALVAKETRTAP